jgi:hypothetical protein
MQHCGSEGTPGYLSVHTPKLRTQRHNDINSQVHDLDRVAISVKSHRLLHQLMHEIPCYAAAV